MDQPWHPMNEYKLSHREKKIGLAVVNWYSIAVAAIDGGGYSG